MEPSSSTAILQNAIGTTISGNTQLINAGYNVVPHGPPAAGMSGLIWICQYYQMVHGI